MDRVSEIEPFQFFGRRHPRRNLEPGTVNDNAFDRQGAARNFVVLRVPAWRRIVNDVEIFDLLSFHGSHSGND